MRKRNPAMRTGGTCAVMVAAVVALSTVSGCAGQPVREGVHPMDWGIGAANMSPEERAQMTECTRYASWSYCRREMLGPGF